jgi:hypothetical protein
VDQLHHFGALNEPAALKAGIQEIWNIPEYLPDKAVVLRGASLPRALPKLPLRREDAKGKLPVVEAKLGMIIREGKEKITVKLSDVNRTFGLVQSDELPEFSDAIALALGHRFFQM